MHPCGVRGVFFDNVTLDEAAQLLRAAARENRSGVSVFTPNSEIVQLCIEDASLRDDIGINSNGVLYMAMALEEEFGIKFRNEDFVGITTVGDVIACIEGKL